MCGGWLGDVMQIDPVGKVVHDWQETNDPIRRKKRQGEEARAQADRDRARQIAEDLSMRTQNNQVLQAEIVAQRRRRAASSLLGRGALPGYDDTGGVGGSNLARGQAYAVRGTLG